MRLAPGAAFGGEFVLETPLGRGAGGEVWLVVHVPTQRRRALKILSASALHDEVARRRFDVEVRVGASIASPHLVDVLAAGVDATTRRPWILMEPLVGETLDARVTRTGPLDPGTARHVLGQLASVLSAAHRAGVVHRDVKPSNVFLEPRADGPFVRLLDFGIAKVLHDAGATSEVGTPTWMAPEQVVPGTVPTPLVDVWAFGLVTFYALTGRRYWVGEGFAVMGEWVEELPRASARAAELGVRVALPAGFDPWFARCVVREPAQRFGSIEAAAGALDALLTPPPPRKGWGRGALLGAVSLAIVVLGIVVGVLAFTGAPRARPRHDRRQASVWDAKPLDRQAALDRLAAAGHEMVVAASDLSAARGKDCERSVCCTTIFFADVPTKEMVDLLLAEYEKAARGPAVPPGSMVAGASGTTAMYVSRVPLSLARPGDCDPEVLLELALGER